MLRKNELCQTYALQSRVVSLKENELKTALFLTAFKRCSIVAMTMSILKKNESGGQKTVIETQHTLVQDLFLISNLNLPGRDGFELLQAEDSGLESIPAFCMAYC